MMDEKKWMPGPANENSDNETDELGRPLKKQKEEKAPLPKREPSETEEWIDGEPPV